MPTFRFMLLFAIDNIISTGLNLRFFLVGGHRDHFFLVGHCKIIIVTVIVTTTTTTAIHMLYSNFRFACILLCSLSFISC